jgi:putative transposase
MNGLKNCGVQDCLIAEVDGLTGFPDAINTVFPDTEARLYAPPQEAGSHGQEFGKIHSLQRPESGNSISENIYLAPSADAASAPLEEFAEKRGGKYPAVSKSWRGRRDGAIPFMKFSLETRRTYGSQVVYTANVIESVNYTLQRNLKTRRSFPNDEAAMKLIFMILKRISKRRAMPLRNWSGALNQFAIIYGGRVPL